jgi:peptidoglycan/LPS O-acetylase OafA/YrhL
MQQRVRAAKHAGAAPRQAGLTRLRFFFIGWVILYHLNLPLRVDALWPQLHWPEALLRHGYLGVDGFFLLSGFALWLGYGTRPPWSSAAVRDFLLRRVAKIWPLHALALLALALLVGLSLLAGLPIRDPERFGLDEFVLQLLLINAWETSGQFAWNYPSWALSVEWAGYLAFPLLLRGVVSVPRWASPLLALAALGGLWRFASAVPELGLNWTLHLGLVRFGLEFTLGLTLGRMATEGMLPRALPLLAVAALPIGVLWWDDALSVLGLAGLIVAVWQAGTTGSQTTQPAPARPDLLLRLGEASFGVYLCWVFVEAALVLVLRLVEPGPAGRVGLMLGGFVASLVAGWLAWRWVEVPAHRWIMHRAAAPARRQEAGAAARP